MVLRIFLNEPSFEHHEDFEALKTILLAIVEARRSSPNLSRVLYCSRRTGAVNALQGERLLTSIGRLPKEERGVLMSWLGKNGPFLDEEREDCDDDLYHLYSQDVTDLGPGEAARQVQRGSDGRLFSSTHLQTPDYRRPTLPILHGLIEEPLATVAVQNLIVLSAAKAAADAEDPEPTSWTALLDTCRQRFGRLAIGRYCDEVLAPSTFYTNVARRTIELLNVLNTIVGECDETGTLTVAGEALKQKHFVGKKAWFTDESDENKIMFAADMTFPDPANAEKTLRCFWHGKIKSPQFRVHFDWPILPKAGKIKIAYIGPKLSKK